MTISEFCFAPVVTLIGLYFVPVGLLRIMCVLYISSFQQTSVSEYYGQLIFVFGFYAAIVCCPCSKFAAEIETSPVPCLVTDVTDAVCGGDFTVWLSSVEGASILYVLWNFKIFILFCLISASAVVSGCCLSDFLKQCCSSLLFSTAGLPQYGQLGHGTDNEVYFYSNTTDHWFGYYH